MHIDAPEPAEPRKTGHRALDLVVSLCALFMSGVSIFMAYHTGQSMERLVHANSWPFIQMQSGNFDDKTSRAMLVIGVKNAGTGVARIERFEMLVDGRPVSDPGALFEACCSAALAAARAQTPQGELTVDNLVTANISRTFLPAGEELNALAWVYRDNNHALWKALDDARQARRITTRACYCSAFDECWQVSSTEFRPAPVRECPAASDQTFW